MAVYGNYVVVEGKLDWQVILPARGVRTYLRGKSGTIILIIAIPNADTIANYNEKILVNKG